MIEDEDLFPEGEHEIPDQDPDNFGTPNLSPEEVTDEIARSIARALESTGLIEIKEMNSSVGQCHFFGRVKDEDKKSWGRLKKKILVAMRNQGDIFVGTQELAVPKKGANPASTNLDDYIHKFGHLISLGAPDLKTAAAKLCQIMAEDNPRKKMEVMECPMLGRGAPQSGGFTTGRKGAHPISLVGR